ncbi:MAG TPA: XdhC family protein, partial [Herpetosiphonaceae bacterium]|nr:XdhC family protein [Herpetosiphonaceae bacterium]
MREILHTLEAWHGRGEALAMATVVRAYGSAPRGPGARLLVGASGAMAGSVSGGCVEGAVVAAALEAIEGGQPRLLDFGISDDQAWDVGLACGGIIAVLVEPLDAASVAFWLDSVRPALEAERPWALAVALDGPSAGARWLIDPAADSATAGLDEAVRADALALLDADVSEVRSYELAGAPASVFIEVHPPAPHLVIVGAVHIASALCAGARELGWTVSIVDPRGMFATRERFPGADALLAEWPDDALPRLRLDRSTYVAVLTHDPKLDDPAILTALKHPVRYIGVLGSRKTQAKLRDRLREHGVSEDDLARLRGPIGLP